MFVKSRGVVESGCDLSEAVAANMAVILSSRSTGLRVFKAPGVPLSRSVASLPFAALQRALGRTIRTGGAKSGRCGKSVADLPVLISVNGIIRLFGVENSRRLGLAIGTSLGVVLLWWCPRAMEPAADEVCIEVVCCMVVIAVEVCCNDDGEGFRTDWLVPREQLH